jgi:selenocysteine-specific translation elongation factor
MLVALSWLQLWQSTHMVQQQQQQQRWWARSQVQQRWQQQQQQHLAHWHHQQRQQARTATGRPGWRRCAGSWAPLLTQTWWCSG